MARGFKFELRKNKDCIAFVVKSGASKPVYLLYLIKTIWVEIKKIKLLVDIMERGHTVDCGDSSFPKDYHWST